MKNMTHSIRLLTFAGAAFLIATSAPAAITVVGTTSSSAAAPPSLATSGALLQALDFGSSTAFLYQGVTFAPANVTGGASNTEAITPFTITLAASNGNIANATVGTAGTASGLFETELFNANSTTSGPPLTLTISGLNAATSYEFQFLHGDTRSQFPYSNVTQTFTDSISGETVSTQLSFNTMTSNQYTDTIIDVAGITSFTYSMPPGAVRGPSFSALEINQVPEPSTWALLALGVAGLGVVTLRRRSSAAARA